MRGALLLLLLSYFVSISARDLLELLESVFISFGRVTGENEEEAGGVSISIGMGASSPEGAMIKLMVGGVLWFLLEASGTTGVEEDEEDLELGVGTEEEEEEEEALIAEELGLELGAEESKEC